ncbi:aldo/keto reductase [Paeniglutamicibacter sp. Y32M11]|uniref:aldo/keto reductase n=1 Tax=Paeniglutamicibacter sp. Y32M11 TaxID=2853258 RepID=UPI001C52CFA5|nr:aldo/keto reductase [Paeniglutamicibacter sp. Y32M11]QXQ11749.1 aldo/keto reductase [Paeniglutamicibacter sp. Y32M11]
MSDNHAAVPLRELNNGAFIPSIGLGTWPLDDIAAGAAVVHALDAGYRLIDTAENYGNEKGIGEGIGSTSIPREELFITSKFNVQWHSLQGVQDAWEHSCQRLGVEYLDLFLIHWPNPQEGKYVAAWEGLVKLLKRGRVRAIGTSNFTTGQLQELIEATGVAPDVNQIQHSPFWLEDERLAFHAKHGILTEGWAPLGRGKHDLLQAAPVLAAARAHDVTPAQAVLRWQIERGVVPIPKTSDPSRLAENLDVFAFNLSAEEILAIDSLNGTADKPADPMTFGH